MISFFNKRLIQYLYIVMAFIIIAIFSINMTINFVDAWFTDSVTEYNDEKVQYIKPVILQNGVAIGGTTAINHNNTTTQEDDIYTFTSGTTPEFSTPTIGNSVTVNLQVKNEGWAEGLLRLTGFTIYVIESFENKPGTNNVVLFENQITIANSSEVWSSQYVEPLFEEVGDPSMTPMAYNWYLNRKLAENETANVVTTITNQNIDPALFDKFYISFRLEMIGYEANAYKTNGNNPPFGTAISLPTAWTAWQ